CFGCGRHPPPLHEPPEPADGRDRQLRSHGDQRPQPDGDAKLSFRPGLLRVKINSEMNPGIPDHHQLLQSRHPGPDQGVESTVQLCGCRRVLRPAQGGGQ
ncbi:30S ribosomal protein S6, partial [Dysosmobacter welbionis]